MRVPVPLVLLLCLSVIGGVWWANTKGMDFMTPPTAARIAEIQEKAEASNAQPERVNEPVKPPTLRQVIPDAIQDNTPQPPPIGLGDLDSPPTLEAYSDRALDGHAKLAELAAVLEKEGEFQRALLAWERSLDMTKPDTTQAATALAAIRRLRPTLPDWNSDPALAIHIALHAGTGPSLAPALKPVLEEAARELTLASGGILRVTADLAVGKRNAPKGPIPAALWLSGPTGDSASTDVLSFTVEPTDDLGKDVYQTVFQLVASHLKRTGRLTPPVEPSGEETHLEALQSHITRLSWREFGKSLNTSSPDE
ncbi:MAG: hypothetical protein EOP87_01510 [Verrucomicrobiaceae bacterium]|nr:MAG: hypothetical protein EOP87_01510 [Verrucomicrobiaceae bacterium]